MNAILTTHCRQAAATELSTKMSSDTDSEQLENNDDGEATLKTLSTCNFNDQILVLVGSTEEQSIVHKDIICAKSRFFKAACSERWAEGKQKTVRLPEVDPRVFKAYLSWVYTGALSLTSLATEMRSRFSVEDQQTLRLLDIYLLGDALDDVRVRNKAMQVLVMDTDRWYSPFLVNKMWERTPENSPMKEMIVDRGLMRAPSVVARKLAQYPEGFVLRVAASLLDVVTKKDKDSFEAKLPSYLEPVD